MIEDLFHQTAVKLGDNELGYNELLDKANKSQMIIFLHKSTRSQAVRNRRVITSKVRCTFKNKP